MNEDIEIILTFLSRERVRATYGAVGEAIGGVPGRAVGSMLGDRRPEASWVVNSETGLPTGYERGERAPDLTDNPTIIRTGLRLLGRMVGLQWARND